MILNHINYEDILITNLNQVVPAALRMNQQNITLGINSKPMAGKTADTPILTAIIPLKPADKDPIPKLRKKLIP